MEANNFNDLFKQIEKVVQQKMKNNVGKKVQEVMSKQVHKTVYSVPESDKYKRLMDDGGLSDIDNIQITELQGELGIEVQNMRRDGSRYVAQIVESGVGYHPNTNPIYATERPFTRNTAMELEQTKEHIDALKSALRAEGIDVE